MESLDRNFTATVSDSPMGFRSFIGPAVVGHTGEVGYPETGDEASATGTDSVVFDSEGGGKGGFLP